LSFATPEQMLAALGLTPGSVSVLGLLNDGERRVHLLIDRDLLGQEYVGVHPNINTSTLKLAVADLTERILPALGVTPRYVELPWDPDAET
jgi:Ala-tRNA(Pro) deacylase